MKLTQSQQEILDKMASGWELGYTMGARSPGWYSLQKGRQGFGGESMRMNSNTINALERRGLIKRVYGFPTSRYILV